jgi:hypothetical protein
MASTVCNQLSRSIATRKCLTSGGIKSRAWVGQVEDFLGKTYNAGLALSSFALAEGAKFITATGRAKKGSGSSNITKSADAGLSNEQTVVLEVAYNSAQEAKDLMDFLRADGKTVFLETNAGTIRQYFAEFGDESAAAEEGTGTALSDANGVLKITLKGAEQDLPLFFEAVNAGGSSLTQLAASIDFLDALVTG